MPNSCNIILESASSSSELLRLGSCRRRVGRRRLYLCPPTFHIPSFNIYLYISDATLTLKADRTIGSGVRARHKTSYANRYSIHLF